MAAKTAMPCLAAVDAQPRTAYRCRVVVPERSRPLIFCRVFAAGASRPAWLFAAGASRSAWLFAGGIAVSDKNCGTSCLTVLEAFQQQPGRGCFSFAPGTRRTFVVERQSGRLPGFPSPVPAGLVMEEYEQAAGEAFVLDPAPPRSWLPPERCDLFRPLRN